MSYHSKAWQDNPEPPDEWEEDDWTEASVEAIPFPEPEPDEHLEADYAEANGDMEDGGPPF